MTENHLFQIITGSKVAAPAVVKPSISGPAVFSTVVSTSCLPLFGTGNMGRLAVNTVANRLLAAGAEPRYLSGSVVVDMDTLPSVISTVAEGMYDASVEAEMEWCTLESCIIPDGPSKGIAITLTGVGTPMTDVGEMPHCPRSGDAVILTGPIGGAGAAMAGMERGLLLEDPCDGIPLIEVMRAAFIHIADITSVHYPNNGLAATLSANGIKTKIDRNLLPVKPSVKAACATMGLDPAALISANAMLITARPNRAREIVKAVKRYRGGEAAAIVGEVL